MDQTLPCNLCLQIGQLNELFWIVCSQAMADTRDEQQAVDVVVEEPSYSTAQDSCEGVLKMAFYNTVLGCCSQLIAETSA